MIGRARYRGGWTAALCISFVLSGCRPENAQLPQPSYAGLAEAHQSASVIIVPFTIALNDAQTGIAESPNLATAPKSPWRDLNCGGSTSLSPAARMMCGAFAAIGRVVGATQYRFQLAPDRRSIAVSAQNAGVHEAAFSIDGDIGYEVDVRNKLAQRSCGDPHYERNPKTRKQDYLHFHLHEEVEIAPTSDFKLEAAFKHTLRPDAPCRIDIFPPAPSDVTAAITSIEEAEVARSEEHLSAELAPASQELHAAAAAAWRRLQTPYPVPSAFGLSLALHPKSVALLPLKAVGSGDHLSIEGAFEIAIAPELTSERTVAALVPLPALARSSASRRESNTIGVTAVIAYAGISKMLQKRFDGERFRYGILPAVKLQNIAVYPTTLQDAAGLAVEVSFRGPLSGTLYAWGTPKYDPTAKTITVANLHVSPNSRGFLSQAIGPMLRGSKFEHKLRSDAHFNIGRLVAALNAQMSRPYRSQMHQVVMDGRLAALTVTRAELAREGIAVHFNVDLTSSVEATFNIAPLFERKFSVSSQ